MKNYSKQAGTIIGGILMTTLICLTACKKTNNYYGELIKTPEIYTTLLLDYSRDIQGASRQYHVGDTLLIKGRFDATPSQISLKIGAANASVIDVIRKDSTTQADQVTYYKTVEAIRVLLTDAMGTGRLPVTVNCRGFAIDGPSLYLLPKGATPSVTDTMVWKQLLGFRSYSAFSNLRDSFLSNPVFYPSFSGTGNIFFSRKSSIQLLHPDGSITLVTDLQNSADAKGPFSIVKMYNGVVDPQEHTLYFSAMTADSYKTPGSNGTAVDADSNWIFRFCRLDLATKQLNVLNRTIVPIYKNNILSLGTNPNQLQALYAGEGQLSQLNLLPFSNAWADHQGNVYFTPIGLTDLFPWSYPSTGKIESPPAIWSNFYYRTGFNYLGKINANGQVQYLMKGVADWPNDGLPNLPYLTRNTILSFDPVKGIMFTGLGISGSAEVIMYDLNSHSTLAKLFPRSSGAGPIGPFNLLDPIALSNGAYPGFFGNNGRFWPMPGIANRFLYDMGNIVYDFSASQAYRYAPVIIDSIRYSAPRAGYYDPNISTIEDLPVGMLNYDKEGNLYKLSRSYTIYVGGYAPYYDVRRTYLKKQ